jgi:hypothetical protein
MIVRDTWAYLGVCQYNVPHFKRNTWPPKLLALRQTLHLNTAYVFSMLARALLSFFSDVRY